MKWLRRLFLIPLFLWLLTGLAEIGPKERGVVRRFGRVVATPGPGLWIGWPWGIDKLDRVSIASVQRLNVGYKPQEIEDTVSGQQLTGDQNLINISVNLDYSVGEGTEALIDYVSQRERSESILVREAESAISEWIAGQSVDDVLLTGNAALPRWLADRLEGRLADHHLGIRVQQISVDFLSPPEKVRGAFEEVNRSQTNIRTQEFRAKQEAELRMKSAQADRFRFQQEAASYAETQLTLAVAEAQSFLQRLTTYRQLKQTNPDVLTFIWWNEMSKLLLGMKSKGRIDLMDNHIGADGLDVTQMLQKKK
ncbi:hypothetical protein KIH39_13585 [Telmatocola sphagniphila]|uniref:Band 7 domain-containing protein n=1 Tax=Telmatocola sphagniphila TaxID=1123043 RepID=A0A8E6ETG4_9BACT|nr:SPFH domain-containing protein [Telmatocola sphagniphila]QVL29902.1 hypothetical protein KIH39_13585 [Telmatocola sphagniphila]